MDGNDDASQLSPFGSGAYRSRTTKLRGHKTSIMSAPGPSKTTKRMNAFACEPCRKRKSKCDSNRPTCSACASVYHTDCSYDKMASEPASSQGTRSTKPRPPAANTNAAIEDLIYIISSLLNKPDVDRALVEQLDEVQQRLGGTSALETTPGPTSPNNDGSIQLKVEHLRIINAEGKPFPAATHTGVSKPAPAASPVTEWFSHPMHEALISELFNLFFTLDNAFFGIISPRHFLASYHNRDKQFCSKILVHAIIARAFTYYHGRLSAAVPDEAEKAKSYGNAFHAEACRLMFMVVDPCLTAVQALTIMGLHEAACGREEYGYRWHGVALRMAMEMNMHLTPPASLQKTDPIEVQERRRTFWAVYNVEVQFAVFMGKPSQVSVTTIGIPRPFYSRRSDSMVPQIARGSSHDIESEIQKDILALTLSEQLCNLSEIAQYHNVILYSPGCHFDMLLLQKGVQAYRQWEAQLPSECQLTGHQSTGVTMLHLYHKQLLINLLRPFQSYDFTAVGLNAMQICWESSLQALHIWRVLRTTQTLGEIHAATIGVLRQVACVCLVQSHLPQAVEVLGQVLDALNYLATCHVTARRSILLVRDLAASLSIHGPTQELIARYIYDDERLASNPRAPSLAFFAVQAHLTEDIQHYQRIPSPAVAQQHEQQHQHQHQHQQQQQPQQQAHAQQYHMSQPQDPLRQHQYMSPVINSLADHQMWSHLAPEQDPYYWPTPNARNMSDYLTAEQIHAASAPAHTGAGNVAGRVSIEMHDYRPEEYSRAHPQQLEGGQQ